MSGVPHPVPYQGSKRLLAPAILARAGSGYRTLIEPFAGSAAITLAAASAGIAATFSLSDALSPLSTLWSEIVLRPSFVASGYEKLWRAQSTDDEHYERVREDFNAKGGSARLLYLLSRCVKAAVRFNRRGEFNQSPDRRRRGANPARVREHVESASRLLSGRTRVVCSDFEEELDRATPQDLVYLDPPFRGTSLGKDPRYVAGLDPLRLHAALAKLRERRVPVIVSYDGTTGGRDYGPPLPRELGLARVLLPGARSSQATLLGRRDVTREALYVAPECGLGAAR